MFKLFVIYSKPSNIKLILSLKNNIKLSTFKKNQALSHGHIEKLEIQLREEVHALLAKAAETAQQETEDDHDLPAEIALREQRLQAMADAKAKIAYRAAQRDHQAQKECAEKAVRSQVQREAGEKPRGKAPETDTQAKDQINLTNEDPLIMSSHEGFVQDYNGKAVVDVDSMLIVAAKLTQQTNDKKQVESMLDELGKLPPCWPTTATSAKTTSKPPKTGASQH